MTRFCMLSRRRRGMDRSASATRRSNRSRCNGTLLLGVRRPILGERPHVVALVLDRAPIAQRLGPADATPVQDQRIRGTSPSPGRLVAYKSFHSPPPAFSTLAYPTVLGR